MVNRAANRLPLQIADASRKVENNEFDPNEEDLVRAKIQEKADALKAEKGIEVAKKEEAMEEKKDEGKEGETKEGGEKKEEPKQSKKEKKEKKKKEEEKK